MSEGLNPADDPAMQSRLTVRLEMFEVYEGKRLLCVTSDPSDARRIADEPGDQVVKCWWVREGIR